MKLTERAQEMSPTEWATDVLTALRDYVHGIARIFDDLDIPAPPPNEFAAALAKRIAEGLNP